MPHVISKDRTRIAFDRQGSGPPLILVDGALCYRAMGPSTPLAAKLAQHFTVLTYDRRGRGESGDTIHYAVEREVEDLQALIAEAGGEACLYGVSSGGMLALETANVSTGVSKVAVYEAPIIVDASRPPMNDDWARMGDAVSSSRPGEAVRLFMRGVGMPALLISVMRLTPVWKKLKGVAHTLPYDGALMKEYQQGRPLPARRWASVTMPALVLAGGKSPPWMRQGARALADVLPSAEYCTIDGQTHMVKPDAHAPVLVKFFKG